MICWLTGSGAHVVITLRGNPEKKTSSRGGRYVVSEGVAADGAPIRIIGFGSAANTLLQASPGDRVAISSYRLEGNTYILTSRSTVSIHPVEKLSENTGKNKRADTDKDEEADLRGQRELTPEEAEDLRRRLHLLAEMGQPTFKYVDDEKEDDEKRA